MENLGFQVEIKLKKGFGRTLRNVTRIHYDFSSALPGQIIFESDIHSTGITMMQANIQEFEAVIEFEKAENF